MPVLDGYPVEAGGRKWIVPEMRTKTARKYLPYITGEKEQPKGKAEMLALLTETVLEILVPNYPDLTLEAVEEMFSPREYNKIIEGANLASEWIESGESRRASQNRSTGEQSTAG